MKWKNYGLIGFKELDSEQFTTDAGIKIRRAINPLVRKAARLGVGGKKVIVDKYPNLEKDKAYIFASGHYFPDEIAAGLSALDRHAYVLIGTTDHVDHNPKMYLAWANGLIYINRLDPDNRKDSMKKMARILKSGSSVYMFPEGVLNNSENLYCQPLFPGVYYLAQETDKLVVPMVSQYEYGDKEIHISFGDPIDFKGLSKIDALRKLRDELSTLRFDLINQKELINRSSLTGDLHLKHLEERKNVYLEVPWTKDVWDEEIRVYHESWYSPAKEVRASLENVKVTPENAYILAPTLAQIEEDKKYDIVRYMKKNWNRK